jgi:hypothetical protein
VKFVGGLDETCQVLYNGLQDVHKIGAKTQCVQGAQRILMERNDKPRKGLSTPCKHNGKHTHLTTSFYIRSASHDASASIYIRITEGRGAQFRFNTGHRLNKASSWNAKARSVRSVACESYELLNLQLRRLETTIEAKAIEAKSKGQVRSKGFYGAIVSSFSLIEEAATKRTSHWTILEAFQEFRDQALATNSPFTGKRLKASTLETYCGTARHLAHIGLGDTPLTMIDIEWYTAFMGRSEDGGLNQTPLSLNYIGKHVKNIKRVLGYSEELGQVVHRAYRSKSFKVHQETVDDIYLSTTELEAIRSLDLSSHRPSLALTRDLFLVGCFTGLRVSDYSRLTSDRSSRESSCAMMECRHPIKRIKPSTVT